MSTIFETVYFNGHGIAWLTLNVNVRSFTWGSTWPVSTRLNARLFVSKKA
jgi:hypothetical protein